MPKSLFFRLIPPFCGLPSILVAAPLTGGEFTLTGTVGTAPVSVQGGLFELDGTAGDPYGGTSRGEDFVLVGGWFAAGEAVADIRLSVRLRGDGRVEISWPEDAFGYVLEVRSSTEVRSGWEPVAPPPTGHSYVATSDGVGRYFRLRQP